MSSLVTTPIATLIVPQKLRVNRSARDFLGWWSLNINRSANKFRDIF